MRSNPQYRSFLGDRIGSARQGVLTTWFTRPGPEGSVIWMAPDDRTRKYIVERHRARPPPEMRALVEKMMSERSGGKVFLDRRLEGPLGGHEIIASSALNRAIWNWR